MREKKFSFSIYVVLSVIESIANLFICQIRVGTLNGYNLWPVCNSMRNKMLGFFFVFAFVKVPHQEKKLENKNIRNTENTILDLSRTEHYSSNSSKGVPNLKNLIICKTSKTQTFFGSVTR